MSRTMPSGLNRFRSRRGVASALIIMILVLLIFFGVLSLVTAAADWRLSTKRAEWNQQFYQADALATQAYADIDQFCSRLETAAAEPAAMTSLLEGHLAGMANVQDFQLVRQDDLLMLTMLVAASPDQGQGIQLVLKIQAGVISQGSGRLAVDSWAQWQPPFDYDGGNGGIWEG